MRAARDENKENVPPRLTIQEVIKNYQTFSFGQDNFEFQMLITVLTKDVLLLSTRHCEKLIRKFIIFTAIFNFPHPIQVKYVGGHLSKEELSRVIAFRAIDERATPSSGRLFFHIFDPVKHPRKQESLTLNDT